MNTDPGTILLALLPFWEPQIPPLGISSLKTFLREHGYTVTTADANVSDRFSDIANRYFGILEDFVPGDRRGNFRNVGQDVLRNHMQAHQHKTDDALYLRVCRELVYHTFYVEPDEPLLRRLDEVVAEFYGLLDAYISDLLADWKPSIFGLSVYRGNLAASMYALRLTRERFPHIKTVMGGAVFAGELAVGSENLDIFLEKTPYVDTIIAGEGELLFLKYLQGELPASRRVHTLHNSGAETLDLNNPAVKAPDFSDLDLRYYPNLAVSASRSCPFQCSFCTETVYWGKYRKKDPRRVVTEMTELYHAHGAQLFLMCDSLLNPIVTPLAEAFIESDVSLYWDGYLRVEDKACDRENTFLWRRGGFYRARLGIESGSPRVLELMDKKISVEQVKRTVSALADAGIKTTTYWVMGHPGETESDFQLTLDLIEALRDDIYEAWCSPFNYYKTGQVESGGWAEKSRLLYPGEARDMLTVQTWTLDTEPSREEAYRRMNRFTEHCRRLGVPNPYSMVEFYRADERWTRLHKHAAPPMTAFKHKGPDIDECKHITRGHAARKRLTGNEGFNF